MNKRLEKRHARQVARAKMHVKVSEPDVRTPEEIETARERSHAIRSRSATPEMPYAPAPALGHEDAAAEETPKAES
jgi:hypothetical protein